MVRDHDPRLSVSGLESELDESSSTGLVSTLHTEDEGFHLEPSLGILVRRRMILECLPDLLCRAQGFSVRLHRLERIMGDDQPASLLRIDCGFRFEETDPS